MRRSVLKKLLFAPLVLFLLFALFSAENRFQDAASSPSPSPSPSVSPSPKPSATPTPLPGAQNFHQWGSITVFNGLPSDTVRAIAQTNDGVMWFGTDNGLARFDGRRIQNFSPGDSEGAKSILALAVTGSSDLWIGTRAGAFVYVSGQFQPIGGTENHGITRIAEADVFPEVVFIGTEDGLVLRAVKDRVGFLPAIPMFREPLKSDEGAIVSVTGLTRHVGSLIISTSGGGLFEINAELAKSEIKSRSPVVHAILEDSNEGLWLGTDAAKGASGVYVTGGREQPVRLAAPTADVFSLGANDGVVWAGTERYGLFQFVGSKLKKNYTFENTSGGLRSNTVYTLFTDREGVLWIGTNRGVSRFDQTGALQETVSDIPNSNFIRTLNLAPVEGEFIYAGSNRGLFLQSTEHKWIENPGFRNKCIYDIKARNGSSLIIAASDGLFSITGAKLLDGDVRSLSGFKSREYAAVFGRGIFDVTGDRPQSVFSDRSVTAVTGGSNRLWIGTLDKGLMSFDGRQVKAELTPDVLKSGTIWKIYEPDEGGDVWIAGQHGVFLYRNGNAEQISSTEDVRDIWVLPNEFWAATTTRGLLHGNYNERFGWLTSAIGFEQGLPSEKTFSILPVEGGFVIGTNRGVVTYVPGEIAPKLIPVRALSQRAHDLSELAGKIDLEYPQNSLLVEVAGQSSRTFPEEFQYAFVLTNAKGEEVARQLSNDPQYSPSELKSGDYTIEAIAFNRDLLASEPLFIRFSVAKAPFPWTATALGILLAIAVVGLVWAIVEHRRIVQRNRELAAARFDLANEAERERRRIARDLHDQTLADLRNLMLLSDKISPDKPEFRAEIESVSSEIRRICEDLSPSVLENVGLIAALEFLLKATVESSEFQAEENLEDRISLPMNAQLQAYRIAQEVLTNIKRHSSADRVEMSVAMNDENKLSLVITDNGEPFEANGRNATGRGIANIRARASLIKARVNWAAENGTGNKFILEVDV